MIRNAANPYNSFGRIYNNEHPIPIPKQVDLSDNEDVELFIGADDDYWETGSPPPSATEGNSGFDWNKALDTITKVTQAVGPLINQNGGSTSGGTTSGNSGGAPQPPKVAEMDLFMIIGAILLALVLLIVLIKTIKK